MYDAPVRWFVPILFLLLMGNAEAAKRKPTAHPTPTPTIQPTATPSAPPSATHTASPSPSASPSPTPLQLTKGEWINLVGAAANAFMALINLGTLGALLWQLRVSRRSQELTQQSADAATETANAATNAVSATVALERPLVFLVPEAPPRPLQPAQTGQLATLQIVIALHNLGRSPASIVQVKGTARLVDFNVPDNEQTLTEIYRTPPEHLPMIPGEQRGGYSTPLDLTDQDRQDILDGKKAILLFGEILYRDVFGHTRTHGYAWVYTGADDTVPQQPWNVPQHIWNSRWILQIGPESYSKSST